MKYREIYNEYTSLLRDHSRMRLELASLPRGGIVKKRISGKEYYYLQYTLCGKKKTEYLREQDVSLVQSQLSLAEQLRQNIEQIDAHLHRLEAAVKILDAQMSRSFVYLRQCADMDALPVSKRTDAILFANAMTALEGLPAREETERNLNDWASGKLSFADFYLPALQNYHVMEDDHA